METLKGLELIEVDTFFNQKIDDIKDALKSRSLVERTIDSLLLEIRGEARDLLIKKYIKSMRFQTISTDILEITIRDNTRISADFLNTLVENYIQADLVEKKRMLKISLMSLEKQRLSVVDSIEYFVRTREDLKIENKNFDANEIISIESIINTYVNSLSSIENLILELEFKIANTTTDIRVLDKARCVLHVYIAPDTVNSSPLNFGDTIIISEDMVPSVYLDYIIKYIKESGCNMKIDAHKDAGMRSISDFKSAWRRSGLLQIDYSIQKAN